MSTAWLLVFLVPGAPDSNVRTQMVTEHQCKAFVRFFAKSADHLRALKKSSTVGFCIAPNGERWHVGMEQ